MKWLKRKKTCEDDGQQKAKNTRQIWQSKIMIEQWTDEKKDDSTQQSRRRMEKNRREKKMICQKWCLPIDWRKFVCVMENTAYCSKQQQIKLRKILSHRLSFDPKNPVESRKCSIPSKRILSCAFFLFFSSSLAVFTVFKIIMISAIQSCVFVLHGIYVAWLIGWLADFFLLLLLLRFQFGIVNEISIYVVCQTNEFYSIHQWRFFWYNQHIEWQHETH